MTALERPSWHETYFALAETWARRGTCPRLKVGCVIVDEPSKIVLCSGYNGAVRGAPHCADVGCLIVEGHCLRAVHSETGAIAQAARLGIRIAGATIYVTEQPCLGCANAIIQAGLGAVRLRGSYGDPTLFQETLNKFKTSGVRVYRHEAEAEAAMETRLA